ncbi:ZIP zinc/iron transport family [Epithele typhae]|uniref:ZIP zinc/iron transport family n=1 Tax=Epithele typhae TaxID=378194 RepID=UPI00200880B2|nr:ZIP zinc/iron transport family [Epithele typhae]KAH9926241.1 ZIP zinc/iron transport family [Epithele typhae]
MRHHARLAIRDDGDVQCGSGGGDQSLTSLRIAAIFIILATSLAGALFPVLARRTKWLSKHVPQPVFETAKYFGSGVIIATALIHLLAPAIEELDSECLPAAWGDYPYALAICLVSIFSIFMVELVAFRWGTARLARLGLAHDAHGHGLVSHAAHGPETDQATQARIAGNSSSPAALHVDIAISPREKSQDSESLNEHEHAQQNGHLFPPHKHSHHHHHPHAVGDSAVAQIVGIAILEFGVLLHSLLIGLTLAVTEEFKVLFIVIIFHQTFEGLGVGSRLAFVQLPPKYNFVPVLGAILFGITTPIGLAIGLGVRETYNPGSTTASIVSGILDAFSSGILLYTGLVELMAHEFLFNTEMLNGSNSKLAYALGCMILGAALMSLLGRWA